MSTHGTNCDAGRAGSALTVTGPRGNQKFPKYPAESPDKGVHILWLGPDIAGESAVISSGATGRIATLARGGRSGRPPPQPIYRDVGSCGRTELDLARLA